MFALVFPVIAPVLVAAAIGYTWARTGRPFDTDTVSQLAMNVGVPLLIIDTLMGADIRIGMLADMALAAVLVLTGAGLAGALLLRLMKLPASAFLPSMLFGNTGNMALPLCLFAFGPDGLALAIGYFTATAVVQYTLSTAISAGQVSWRQVTHNTMLWATLLALALKLSGVVLPAWIANSAHLIGSLAVPLMLLALGVSLARLRISSLGRSLFLGTFKILLGVGLGLLAAELLELEGMAQGVLLVQSGMPVAVFNYLFAVRYNRRPEEVAGVVILSTLVSFASLPLLLWIAMGDSALPAAAAAAG